MGLSHHLECGGAMDFFSERVRGLAWLQFPVKIKSKIVFCGFASLNNGSNGFASGEVGSGAPYPRVSGPAGGVGAGEGAR